MNLDWIVAMIAFLLLAVFSFNYYTAFFVHQADLGNVASVINERVTDSITVDSYSVPVYFNSSMDQSDKILYADFTWPHGTENSTAIFIGNIEQQCMISGGKIYWQSSVKEGDNIFRMEFSNVSVPMNCDDDITIESEERATPWSMERETALSQQKITRLSTIDYNRYRRSISVSRDIRIETTGFSYGPLPPRNIDVYAFGKNITIAETSERVFMKVLVW